MAGGLRGGVTTLAGEVTPGCGAMGSFFADAVATGGGVSTRAVDGGVAAGFDSTFAGAFTIGRAVSSPALTGPAPAGFGSTFGAVAIGVPGGVPTGFGGTT
jgi:hypothetical protein